MNRLRFQPRLIALASVACLSSTIHSHAAEGEKDHVLFMGADFGVEVDGKVCPVRDVSGSYWVVEKDGSEMRIATRRGNFSLKVAPTLKLTERSAMLADYSATVGYSPKNDPSVRLTRALDNAAAANIGRETAVTQAEVAYIHAAAVAQQVAASSGKATALGLPGTNPYENRNYESAVSQAVVNQANAGDVTDGEPTAELYSQGKDAVDVTFVATTDRELDDAYIVTVAKFRARGDKPGAYRNLIYARGIGTIDANRRTISVNEIGFPPGFELLDFELHLFHRGEELATNLSRKRVELTGDEAFEYVKTTYVGSNAGKTLPAEPAMGRLPSDFRSRLASGKFGNTIFVRVGSDGVPSDVYSDRDCSKKIEDPYIEAVVSGLRFTPALEAGKPVASVASVRLDQLKI